MNTNLLNNYCEIARLIAEQLSGTLSMEEQERLDRWLKEDVENQKIYEDICLRLKEKRTKSYEDKRVILEDWHQVRKQVAPYTEKRNRFRKICKYAAVAVLLIGIGLGALHFLLLSQFPEEPFMGQAIQPGSCKAILTLANGEKMILEKDSIRNFPVDGAVIRNQSGNLTYNIVKKDALREMYNTITVPRGGEYRLTLSDGTNVWINSDSELKYPVSFTKNERIVTLKGEAYFEVAAAPSCPFIVKTDQNMSVKVLGTHFNVSAYQTDEVITTTLAEGRVEVSDGTHSWVLQPDQQSLYTKKNNAFHVQEVNASIYTSWKDGMFIFEGETLENIMQKISRWYDVEVFYASESVKQLQFSGDLERFSDFETVLKMLEKVTRIKFEIKNKRVLIKKL